MRPLRPRRISRHDAARGAAAAAAAILVLAAATPWAASSTPERARPSLEGSAAPARDAALRDDVGTLRKRFRLDSKAGLTALRDLSLGVLHQGLKDDDLYERCYAASALAEQGDWSGTGILESGVASPDPGVRRAAIEGLGEVGRGEALRILRRIYAESDPFGQLLVLQGLRGGGSGDAFDLMIAAIEHEDGSLRLQAAENLGLLGDSRAVPPLRKLLAREDVRMFERVTAAQALLRLGDGSGVPLLLSALDGDAGTGRAAAALALGYAKQPRLVSVLRKLLHDPEIDVTIAAAAALSRYGKTDGLPQLRKAIADEDGFTRRHASMLLEHLEYGVARDVILAALEADDVDVRLAAAHVVGVAGHAKDIDALTRRMRADDDALVRADLAWALGRMASPAAIAPLVELVQEESPTVRYTAAEGLARATHRLMGMGKDG